ncbi:hypothetical protein [Nocardia carnea]|uniref:hypothetical protein n=1 Tax=Nocardia carnea TaxID=37328 RepID=UPI00245469A4|nr:hypothetical protein [Nocardia carnea]
MDLMFSTGIAITFLASVVTVAQVWRGAVTRRFRRFSAAISIAGLVIASVGTIGGGSSAITKALVVGFALAFSIAMFVVGFVLTPKPTPLTMQDAAR